MEIGYRPTTLKREGVGGREEINHRTYIHVRITIGHGQQSWGWGGWGGGCQRGKKGETSVTKIKLKKKRRRIYCVLPVEYSSVSMASKQVSSMGTVVTGGDTLLDAIVYSRATCKYGINTGDCTSDKGVTSKCWPLWLGYIIGISAQIA
uniref:Uncharacterized protein n=1 Tax=Molossus molossus TaxID=27622 RepID=A0A7J8DPT8_MOLMO|nr:hypothetical protein HJG59_009290 [Molossus molossus]